MYHVYQATQNKMQNINGHLLKIAIVGTPKKQNEKMLYTISGRKVQSTSYTLGLDVRTFDIQVDDQNIKLIFVLDLLTQEDRSVKKVGSIYRGASAILIAFDKSDLDSYTFATVKVPKEMERIKSTPILGIPKQMRESWIKNPPIALVGFTTESDAVPKDQVQALADKRNYSYFETTPTDKDTIKEIFYHLTRQALAVKEK